MSALDGDRAPSRAHWTAVIGLALLFASWAAFALLAVPLTRSLWSGLSSDFVSAVAIAIQTSAAWVVLVGALLLLLACSRSERGRIAAGSLGCAVGVLALSAVLSSAPVLGLTAPGLPAPGLGVPGLGAVLEDVRLLERVAAGGSALGGALLVMTPILRGHRALPQHLDRHRHRAIHGLRAIHGVRAIAAGRERRLP